MKIRSKKSRKVPRVILLTDFGTQDHYAGVLRGVLLRACPELQIVDLTHGIPPQDIAAAAYALKSSYRYFPEGSVFLCVVDPGVGTSRKLLAVRAGGSFFLAPDNGLLTPTLYELKNFTIREIRRPENCGPIFSTFHGRDLLAPAAAALASRPATFQRLWPIVRTLHPSPWPAPRVGLESIQGRILGYDHFGNAVTTIEKRHWPEGRWKRAHVQAGRIRLGEIVKTYASAERSCIALWNSSNHLELAVPQGSAKKCLSLSSTVSVEVTP